MKLSRLVYRSAYGPKLSKEDLKKILAASHENNPKRNVSGVLCLDDGHFLQMVEGPHDALNELLYKLMHDERHQDIEILEFSPNKETLFGKWAMLILGDDHQTRQILKNCTGQSNIRPWQIDRELMPEFFDKIARLCNEELQA